MKSYIAEALNGVQYVFAALQQNETLQYIELGLSILTSIILIAFRIWRWVKEAKADGKITKEEIEEGAKIIVDGAQEIAGKTKEGIKGSQTEDEDKREEIEKDSGKGI